MKSSIIIIFSIIFNLIFAVHLRIQTDLSDIQSGTMNNIASGPAETIQTARLTGSQLYIKQCLVCHQANGTGVPSMFPPLAGNDKIKGPSSELIKIVLFGLKGSIKVNGRDYNQVMPPQAYLSDKQIADILSYIRTTWGNKASLITPAEVGKIRKMGNARN
jgi:mono/diheme cytochrome c family protein